MKNVKAYIPLLILLVFFLLASSDVEAQCAMCKAQAETTHAEGNRDVAGLNMGILYLFFAPFLIIGTIAYLWKRNAKVEV